MLNEDTLLIDDLDEALIGACMTWHGDMLVERCIYDGMAIVERLVASDGMTEEEAIEYIDVNMVGAYVGETTPIIMWPILDELDGYLADIDS
jgi:hypothetical protein